MPVNRSAVANNCTKGGFTMYDYKTIPSWKRKETEDNRMIWAAIGLSWVLLCVDALTKI